MTEVYFSGIEGSLRELKILFEAGYKISNLMTSYASFRKNPGFIEELRKMKEKYKFKLMVDSGAHAFLFAFNVKNKKISKGWHEEAQIVSEFKGRETEYFEEYFKWLVDNIGFYDYAIELDIAVIVGEEVINNWRQRLAAAKLPIVYVLHANAGDTFTTVKEFKNLGATYIGIGALPEEFNKMLMFSREIKKEGMKVHIFAYTPKELFKHKDLFDSVDSTSWLSGSKLAKAVELKGKSLSDVNLKEDKLKKMSLLRNKFFDTFDRKVVEEKTKGNQYWYFNFWNMYQYQKWADTNNGVKGYTKQLKEIEEGILPAPSWMNNFDKNGMPKTKYLASRFNNWKSGVYAKGIQSMAMYCDMCPVGGQSATGEPLCPKYGAGELCLTGDTFLAGDNKDIFDYKENEFVFGRDGYAKVTHKFERDYEGEIYNIKPAGIPTIKATPGHPFLIAEVKRIQHSIGTEKVIKEIKWKTSEELNTSHSIMLGRDYLIIPRMKGVFKNVTFGKYRLDETLSWLMGVYTAEGWTTKGIIQFSIGKHEKEFSKEIFDAYEKIGLFVRSNFNRTAVVHSTRKTELAEVFANLCGRGAMNKKIPEEILLNENLNILKAFIKGYEEGDGCNFSNKMVIGTISKTLAFQLQLAYARLGKFAYISISKRNGKKGIIEGREVNMHDAYSVTYVKEFVLKNESGRRHIITEDAILVPIIEIKKEHYTGKVYNIETTQEEYLANNIVSHNCFFLPHWRKLGMKTRNKEQVVRTLEELVAEAVVRFQFARFQEQLTGVIDKNVTSLYKELVTSLELYNRVAFGVQNVNTLNMLNIGDNKVQVAMNFEDSLDKIRKLYGDKLTKRIEKKIMDVYDSETPIAETSYVESTNDTKEEENHV